MVFCITELYLKGEYEVILYFVFILLTLMLESKRMR